MEREDREIGEGHGARRRARRQVSARQLAAGARRARRRVDHRPVARAGRAARRARRTSTACSNSHCHEDHVAGNHLFPDVPWHLHEADLPGIRSLDGMMAIYGYRRAIDGGLRPKVVVEQFHFTPRADAVRLPRRRRLRARRRRARPRDPRARPHARPLRSSTSSPTTCSTSATSTSRASGPYYGDAWSSLEDFERTLARGARDRRRAGTRPSTTSACSRAARPSSSASTASPP